MPRVLIADSAETGLEVEFIPGGVRLVDKYSGAVVLGPDGEALSVSEAREFLDWNDSREENQCGPRS